MNRPKWNLWPPVIFAVIVLSFLGATGFGQWRMGALDDAVVELASTTAPSIERLAAARSEVRGLQIPLRDRLPRHEGAAEGPPDLTHAREMVDQAIDEYLALPVGAGEEGLRRGIVGAKYALSHATPDGVSAAAAAMDTALTRAIDFNAARSRDLSLEIQHLRRTALYTAIGLDLVCTLVAICGALLLRRVVRAHDVLVERHRLLEKERAAELEQFAGRVAHDILSPLGTVGLALQLAGTSRSEDERARVLERGTAAVRRVKRMVSGLLDFARAGAKPDPSACADMGAVMADMIAELEPEAVTAGAELTLKCDGAMVVACNPGVLTSLIANLTRNAIKYIGDGPIRRIQARVIDRGGSVRVEVEDTGPGLAPDVEDRVFDAYARSRSASQPGIGLGLATVKRLAEGHGGTVGVTSVLGSGCTFWFELPKAGSASPEAFA
jgi:signal transduction histidine kinase